MISGPPFVEMVTLTPGIIRRPLAFQLSTTQHADEQSIHLGDVMEHDTMEHWIRVNTGRHSQLYASHRNDQRTFVLGIQNPFIQSVSCNSDRKITLKLYSSVINIHHILYPLDLRPFPTP